MDAIGVDRAVIFPIEDAWGTWAAQRMPERFALVPMVTPAGVQGAMVASDPWFHELVRSLSD